jgi:hypothetical protein
VAASHVRVIFSLGGGAAGGRSAGLRDIARLAAIAARMPEIASGIRAGLGAGSHSCHDA